ncbi:hypothetical protein E2C01_066033 [Portunus trituberculatus]|uniref:Uncharacterized protein n=1 Tax=Portunus trituberculatus TaxID=210409 RepID=A0A5B7HR83_PORTR|nr:hypothetical protein [Portunus trituberculatus]
MRVTKETENNSANTEAGKRGISQGIYHRSSKLVLKAIRSSPMTEDSNQAQTMEAENKGVNTAPSKGN